MNNLEQPNQSMVAYLDGDLSGDELNDFEKLLASNVDMQEELENLKIARLAVQHYGLKEQVAAVHQDMMAEFKNNSNQSPSKGKSYLFIRSTMKIAASILFFLVLFAGYQYTTVKSSKLFSDNYQPYVWSTERGEAPSSIESYYIGKNFNKVIALLNNNPQPNAQELFLGGQACLSLKQPEKAIRQFNRVLTDTTVVNYYKDDAEYYLALSYLANGEHLKAKVLLEKIYQDKDHLYHDQVGYATILKLKILAFKDDHKK